MRARSRRDEGRGSGGIEGVSEVLRFAHLSDWHATTLAGAGMDRFKGKRLSGFASWALQRRHHHSPAILEAAFRDVQAQAPDRILVTGDLTHISLPSEFEVARAQLARLGPPEQVFLIPGNHDCYVPVDPALGWDRWAPYLRGQLPGEVDAELAPWLTAPPTPLAAPRHADYPTLRLADRIALIGLCSVIPTPIFRAGGELGSRQLERLRELLERLGRRGLFRVILIHHPVHPHGEPQRRALWDADAFRRVLAASGAELVLHGHKHLRRVHFLDGPAKPIPAIGVPSSSEVGSRPERQAQYHVYEVRALGSGGGFELSVAVRGYDAGRAAFVGLPDRLF
jgi:3',5'-cyclic AMP phosphodiesterase CpdA